MQEKRFQADHGTRLATRLGTKSLSMHSFLETRENQRTPTIRDVVSHTGNLGGIMDERRGADRIKPEMAEMRGAIRYAESSGAIPKGTVCSIKHEPDGAGGGAFRVIVKLADPFVVDVHPAAAHYLAQLVVVRLRKTLQALRPSLELIVMQDPANAERFMQKNDQVTADGHIGVDAASLEGDGTIFARLAKQVDAMVRDALLETKEA